MNHRLYNLYAVNERSGFKVRLNSAPLTHQQACTMKSKFTPHPARRIQLEEVTK